VRRGSIFQLLGLGLLFGAAAVAVAVLIPWLPPDASRERGRIDFVFWFTTGICIFIFTIVATVTAYALLKFRARPDDDSDGPPIHGHTGLEIVWTAVPALLVTAIAIVSGIVLVKNGRAGPNPLIVHVTARQFAWTFSYPSAPNVGTSGVLRLPLGRKAELKIDSEDVIHSFWVPEFGQKSDAVPGIHTTLVITPTKLSPPNGFPVICTELCGLGHSVMRSVAIVMKPAAFEAWLHGKTQATAAPTGSTGAAGSTGSAGAAVFTANGCGSCHTLKAAGTSATVGPDLDQLSAEAQRAGQPLDKFVEQSIVDPNAYVEHGFPKSVMPQTFGTSLSKTQLNALVQYLIQSSKGA
jgi:cytochrome c oxidase subunit 2